MATPHLDHFASFQRWSRRALSADVHLRHPGELEETLFAPIRRDREVAGAWVVRGGGDRILSLSAPAAPPSVDWLRLRHERLGEVRVGRWEAGPCPDGCIVLARDGPGEGERLVVAYRPESSTP